jgi:hypothetical protein
MMPVSVPLYSLGQQENHQDNWRANLPLPHVKDIFWWCKFNRIRAVIKYQGVAELAGRIEQR